MKKGKDEKTSFEEALRLLEQIASKLESGELGLEDSISSYEEGMKYAKICHNRLEEAERRIEILQKGEDKSVVSKKVDVKSDTGELVNDDDFQGSLL